MKRIRSVFVLILWFVLMNATIPLAVLAQGPKKNDEELKKFAPSVYMDCRGCDRDFFRTEITFVNYVRDRKEADIHILITEQGTGGGGREYTFAFIGLNDFKGQGHELTYVSRNTDTYDETRKGQVEVLKKGLFPYIINTPIAEYCFVDFQHRLEPTAVEDPWNFWVFNLGLDGELSGEQTVSSKSLDVDFSANRITPELKIRMRASAEWDKETYDYEDETIISSQDEKDFSALVVKSLNDHWSLGGWAEVSSSSYSNIDSHFSFSPALEFNFFPYHESTRRQLRCLYKVGLHSFNYIEMTIYEKTKESLANQSLTLTFEVREPWGSISTSLEGSHYFHDFSKNRLELWGFLNFRIFRGLSVNIRGTYERIHDQLALSIGETSIDELLLRRKELATEYEYEISIGINFTFGSKFSNVVNPRFGGSHRGRWR